MPHAARQGARGSVRRRPDRRRGRAAAGHRARRRLRRSDGARCIRRARSGRHHRRSVLRRSVPKSRIGARCRIGASVVIDGWTEIGDDTQIYPMASIGLAPQDLKYQRRADAAVDRSRQTSSASSSPSIAERRAAAGTRRSATATCSWPTSTWRTTATSATRRFSGNGATLGGHVTVEDFATISAYSGVHQFCRVGRHAYHRRLLGRHQGRVAVWQVGRQPGQHLRAQHDRPGAPRIHPDTIGQLKRAYRYLLQSKLNTVACARPDRAGPNAHVARGARTSSTSSAARARRHPAAADAASGGSGGGRVDVQLTDSGFSRRRRRIRSPNAT